MHIILFAFFQPNFWSVLRPVASWGGSFNVQRRSCKVVRRSHAPDLGLIPDHGSLTFGDFDDDDDDDDDDEEVAAVDEEEVDVDVDGCDTKNNQLCGSMATTIFEPHLLGPSVDSLRVSAIETTCFFRGFRFPACTCCSFCEPDHPIFLILTNVHTKT